MDASLLSASEPAVDEAIHDPPEVTTGDDDDEVGTVVPDDVLDDELDVAVEEEPELVCVGVRTEGEEVAPDPDATAATDFGEPANSPPSPAAAPRASTPATAVTAWTRRTATSRCAGESVVVRASVSTARFVCMIHRRATA